MEVKEKLKKMKAFLQHKLRGVAFKAYYAIRSFVTFHGIFMGPGYDVGKGSSVWNRITNVYLL